DGDSGRGGDRRSSPGGPPAALLIFIFCGNLLFHGGHLYSVDDETHFRVIRSLVERGSWSVEPVKEKHLNLVRGRDGRFYAYYAPATSIVGIPFYLVGRSAARLLRLPERFLTRACFSLQGVFWSLLTAGLLFVLLRRLGATQTEAVLLVLLHNFGTYSFMGFRTVTTNFPVGTFLLSALYCSTGEVRTRSAFLAGLCLGGAFLYRYDALLFLPIFVLACARRGGGRAGAGVVAGLIPAVVVVGVHNGIRFGEWWVTGSPDTANLFRGDFFEGFWGLTFGPNRGLIWYSPLSVAGLFGLAYLKRKHPEIAVPALLCFIVQLLFASSLSVWNGGAAWGPRHLGAVVPLLSLGLWPLWKDSKHWAKVLGVSSAIMLQLFASTVSTDSWNDLLWDHGIPYEASWSTFRYNPWYGHFQLWKRLEFERLPAKYRFGRTRVPVGATPPNQRLRKSLDYWWVYAWKLGVPLWGILPFFLILVLGMCGAGVLLWRDATNWSKI
ncbi:MAG: hypothetical protein D6679_09060, partial [Candidatus Hydrogenedentota bacterium]